MTPALPAAASARRYAPLLVAGPNVERVRWPMGADWDHGARWPRGELGLAIGLVPLLVWLEWLMEAEAAGLAPLGGDLAQRWEATRNALPAAALAYLRRPTARAATVDDARRYVAPPPALAFLAPPPREAPVPGGRIAPRRAAGPSRPSRARAAEAVYLEARPSTLTPTSSATPPTPDLRGLPARPTPSRLTRAAPDTRGAPAPGALDTPAPLRPVTPALTPPTRDVPGVDPARPSPTWLTPTRPPDVDGPAGALTPPRTAPPAPTYAHPDASTADARPASLAAPVERLARPTPPLGVASQPAPVSSAPRPAPGTPPDLVLVTAPPARPTAVATDAPRSTTGTVLPGIPTNVLTRPPSLRASVARTERGSPLPAREDRREPARSVAPHDAPWLATPLPHREGEPPAAPSRRHALRIPTVRSTEGRLPPALPVGEHILVRSAPASVDAPEAMRAGVPPRAPLASPPAAARPEPVRRDPRTVGTDSSSETDMPSADAPERPRVEGREPIRSLVWRRAGAAVHAPGAPQSPGRTLIAAELVPLAVPTSAPTPAPASDTARRPGAAAPPPTSAPPKRGGSVGSPRAFTTTPSRAGGAAVPAPPARRRTNARVADSPPPNVPVRDDPRAVGVAMPGAPATVPSPIGRRTRAGERLYARLAVTRRRATPAPHPAPPPATARLRAEAPRWTRAADGAAPVAWTSSRPGVRAAPTAPDGVILRTPGEPSVATSPGAADEPARPATVSTFATAAPRGTVWQSPAGILLPPPTVFVAPALDASVEPLPAAPTAAAEKTWLSGPDAPAAPRPRTPATSNPLLPTISRRRASAPGVGWRRTAVLRSPTPAASGGHPPTVLGDAVSTEPMYLEIGPEPAPTPVGGAGPDHADAPAGGQQRTRRVATDLRFLSGVGRAKEASAPASGGATPPPPAPDAPRPFGPGVTPKEPHTTWRAPTQASPAAPVIVEKTPSKAAPIEEAPAARLGRLTEAQMLGVLMALREKSPEARRMLEEVHEELENLRRRETMRQLR